MTSILQRRIIPLVDNPHATWFEFIETPVFTRRLHALSTDPLEVLSAIQSDLIDDPVQWPVIPGTGGARKGRAADVQVRRGKRGGYRYLYLHMPARGQIFLLFILDKREQGDLSPEQARRVRDLIDVIREEG